MKIKNKFLYRAFGLTLLSDIPLPELYNFDKNFECPDISIEIGDFSTDSLKLQDVIKGFFIKDGIVMFQIPDTGIFSIDGGNRIIFSPEGKADKDKARLYILGTCMGILLMRRHVLPLHGSVFETNGKAYAIVGHSGAGKSTLASVFLNKGFNLLSDDVIAITFTDEGTPFVNPSYPQQKLWENSLNEFGISSSEYKPLFERETKYAIPIHTNFRKNPLPLAGIFELEKSNQQKVIIKKLNGIDRLKTLYAHTYRNSLLSKLGLMEWHFKQSSKLINAIDIFKLQRSQSGFTAYNLADLIMNTIEGGTKNEDTYTFAK